MIGRWLVRRRERAAARWRYEAEIARMLQGSPIATHAELFTRRARRRIRLWDAALDVWTWRSRKSEDAAGENR